MEWSHRPSPESELESLNYSGPELELEWSGTPGSECRREFDPKVGVGTTLHVSFLDLKYQGTVLRIETSIPKLV